MVGAYVFVFCCCAESSMSCHQNNNGDVACKTASCCFLECVEAFMISNTLHFEWIDQSS